MPRILYQALALTPGGGGVQAYARELIRAVAGTGLVDTAAIVQRRAVAELPRSTRVHPRPDSSGLRRAIHGLRPAPGGDVVHALDVDLPLGGHGPKISTVHDLAVFDVPETMSSLRARAERWLVADAVSRADRVVAVSRFTADRVAERFGRDVDVVPLACRPAMIAGPELDPPTLPFDLPPVFVLHVGTIEPRKNLPVLANACARVGVPLVLAGALWTAPPGGGDVHYLGHVDDPTLLALYRSATIVAVASRYEGFCLPAVEAMANGAAVVATPVGALTDLVPAAGLAVADVDAIAARLAAFLGDDDARAQHAAAGRRRALERTWTDVAAETLDVYRRGGVEIHTEVRAT